MESGTCDESINAGVEFYPDRVRYVDLEIDRVRRPDGRVATIDLDEEKLECSLRSGHLTAELYNQARTVAREIKILAESEYPGK